jgi:hypothetical protein
VAFLLIWGHSARLGSSIQARAHGVNTIFRWMAARSKSLGFLIAVSLAGTGPLPGMLQQKPPAPMPKKPKPEPTAPASSDPQQPAESQPQSPPSSSASPNAQPHPPSPRAAPVTKAPPLATEATATVTATQLSENSLPSAGPTAKGGEVSDAMGAGPGEAAAISPPPVVDSGFDMSSLSKVGLFFSSSAR